MKPIYILALSAALLTGCEEKSDPDQNITGDENMSVYNTGDQNNIEVKEDNSVIMAE